MTLTDGTILVWGKKKARASLLITRDPGASGHKPGGFTENKEHKEIDLRVQRVRCAFPITP